MTKPAAPDLAADAVAIPAAAKLLGLHPERVRQLIRAGFATSPARGHVGLTSLLRGYVASLRDEAERPQSEAAARSFDAKAALLQRQTDARRAELIERGAAEEALGIVRDLALRHVASLARPRVSPMKLLPVAEQTVLRREVKAAEAKIAEAHEAALRALRSGDLGEVEGAA